MKSVVSLKSAASEKSRSQSQRTSAASFKNDDLKFEDVIPSTCAKFCCPYVVVVKREIQEDSPKLSKIKASPRQKKVTLLSAMSSEAKVPSEVSVVYPETTTVVVQAVFDRLLHLVELRFHQQCTIPRTLLQVIALYAPFFDDLTKIHIRRCPIDVYTIHELNKMLQISYITDILLEDTPVPEGNYAILLDSSNLKNLSLHRCKINDEVCKEIAARLHGSEQNDLLFLNLSSNHITDTGARHLGNALRTNRKLLYLNLSDNRLTDTGAGYLLDILCEFPLTYDEQAGKRSRYLKYLRQKQIIYRQFLDENITQDHSLSDSSSARQSRSTEKIHSGTIRSESSSPRTAQSLMDKTEIRASELRAAFVDPFAEDLVTVKDGWTYCSGNLVLCSLNLAYNRLSYITTKKILYVLTHQSSVRTKNQQGLVRIVIEGNPTPATCVEMANIRDIIDSYLNRFSTNDTRNRRKSRATTRVSLQTRKGNDT